VGGAQRKLKRCPKFCKSAEISREIAQEAAEIRLRAERKAGEVLVEMDKRGERIGPHGGAKKSSDTMSLVSLDDLEVTRKQSSRWQEIAHVPEPVFEEYIREGREKESHELTTSGLMTIAKFQRKAEQAEAIRNEPEPLPEGPFRVLATSGWGPRGCRAGPGA
jgi:hypothetical protein